MKKVFEKELFGRKYVVENGEVAKQADGSVVVRCGDTVVLSAVVVADKPNLLGDFFPLTILYQERLYSVGKIPGGFIKREGRPTEAATLAARMIDRPIRPLFPEDFKYEVQVVNTVLSVDQDNSPELTAMLASSIALSISKIPFHGPIAGVKVGYIDNELIINPTQEEAERSLLDLTVAGTKDAINMVESSAKELDEEIMVDALMKGHEAIKELCAFVEEITSSIGLPKMDYEKLEITDEVKEKVEDFVRDRLKEALTIKEKIARYDAINKLEEETIDLFNDEKESLNSEEEQMLDAVILKVFHDLEYHLFRETVLNSDKRQDGRRVDEIRPLSASIDFLPRTHGSSLFTRGETQSLSVVTLGALGENQKLDGLSLETEKRFMLHYNFPQFCVGETGRYGSPGRREIGHGALGEKALLQVMPSEEEFPYAVRVVSETLESNGSSSQASICAGCMALMAAGVPIKAPVAGIAMGLISNGKQYKILTDIQGMEDHLGDMDFKVAGTSKGVCALQMDIKIEGVTREILSEALENARVARSKLLKVMLEAIPKPREEVSKYAPKFDIFFIKPEKIKDVIGKGGETITKIIQEASGVIDVNDIRAVKIDLEDDGRVTIYHHDKEIIKKARELIENQIKEVEIGKIYSAKVKEVLPFGAVIELWPGCEGLIHISKLANERVEKVEDVVKVGDEIVVKALEIDKKGRINFSRKDALK